MSLAQPANRQLLAYILQWHMLLRMNDTLFCNIVLISPTVVVFDCVAGTDLRHAVKSTSESSRGDQKAQ